jgi:hypothetical protein
MRPSFLASALSASVKGSIDMIYFKDLQFGAAVSIYFVSNPT